MKSYTDLEQSKVLSKILPLESADMYIYKNVFFGALSCFNGTTQIGEYIKLTDKESKAYPCWSLTALLKYLSEIKPKVYTPVLFPSEGKWILQFAEYGHGNVCETTSENTIDACYEIILKLHELNLL